MLKKTQFIIQPQKRYHYYLIELDVDTELVVDTIDDVDTELEVDTLDDVDIEDDVDTELEVETLDDVDTDDEVETLVVVGVDTLDDVDFELNEDEKSFFSFPLLKIVTSVTYLSTVLLFINFLYYYLIVCSNNPFKLTKFFRLVSFARIFNKIKTYLNVWVKYLEEDRLNVVVVDTIDDVDTELDVDTLVGAKLLSLISKIQLVVYYQFCVLIG